MKKLLPIVLGLALAGTASAQTVTSFEGPATSVQVDPTFKLREAVNPPSSESAAPLADNVKLSYYQDGGTSFNWQAPWQPDPNQQFLVLGYAQRFTLPTASGYLDSVRIQINQAGEIPAGSGGTINFFVVRDSIFQSQSGPDGHLPLLGDVLVQASVPAAALAGAQNFQVTLNTQHAAVPQNFFVYMRGSFDNTGVPTSAFLIPGEIKNGVEVTTENSRSVFHFITTQGESVGIMDNFFKINGAPVAVNFLMDAFVDVEAGSVARPEITAAAMFPNPVAVKGSLNIEHSSEISSIRIVNMLGNEMQSWTGKSTSVKLSTSDLSAGVYNVIVTTASGVTSEKLIVN